VSDETPPPAPLSARDAILSIDDCEIVSVEVPEWKTTVYLRALPADEGTALGDRVAEIGVDAKGQEARLLLLSATLVDAGGQRLFTTPEDIAKLGKRRLSVLMRLEKLAIGLNYNGDAAKNV
jgi:hypothetical protein